MKLLGETIGEQRRKFCGRDEVAGGPELLCAAAVITQPGCVKRKIHILREIDIAPCRPFANQANERGTMLALCLCRWGQGHVGADERASSGMASNSVAWHRMESGRLTRYGSIMGLRKGT